MTAILQVKGVRKEFGPKLVFDNLNMHVEEGHIFGIVGSSGAGKTTLLNTLIGFYEPEEGDVQFKHNGSFRSIYEHPLEINKLFGFASQQASVYGRLTVYENLDHFGSLYDLPDEMKHKRIVELLKLTKLYESRNRLAMNLSGGMQKRLSIACALIHKPKVLILDEPTSDLDPILRRQTWDIVKDINKKGTTIIVASHFLQELEKMCTEIAVLHNSEILAAGSPNELKNTFMAGQGIYLMTKSKDYDTIIKKLQKLPKTYDLHFEEKNKQLIIYTKDSEKILHYLLHIIEWANDELVNIQVRKPSLVEVFEDLAKR